MGKRTAKPADTSDAGAVLASRSKAAEQAWRASLSSETRRELAERGRPRNEHSQTAQVERQADHAANNEPPAAPRRRRRRRRGSVGALGDILDAFVEREARAVASASSGSAERTAAALAVALLGLATSHPVLRLNLPNELEVQIADLRAHREKRATWTGDIVASQLEPLTLELVAFMATYRRTEGESLGTDDGAWVESRAHVPVKRRGRRRAEPRVVRQPDGPTNEGQIWATRRLDAARAVVRHGLSICGCPGKLLNRVEKASKLREARRWANVIEAAKH